MALFLGWFLKHFDFAQGPTNQVSSPALGSTAVQRAGKRKRPSSNGHPQGEWHLQRTALEGSKAKTEGLRAGRDPVQSAASCPDPEHKLQQTLQPGNQGGWETWSKDQQTSCSPDTRHEVEVKQPKEARFPH